MLQSARWAHQRTADEAAEARRVLAKYELPEVGPATDAQIHYARLIFAMNHRNASWSSETTSAGWETMTREMLARRQARIADAHALKIEGY